VTLATLLLTAKGDICDWLADRRNRRAIPHRLERCGYVPVRNGRCGRRTVQDRGKRQVIYSSATLTLADD